VPAVNMAATTARTTHAELIRLIRHLLTRRDRGENLSAR
jgi:hypothetical protein